MKEMLEKRLAVLETYAELMQTELAHLRELIALEGQPELPAAPAPGAVPHETPAARHAEPAGGAPPADVDWCEVAEVLKRLHLLAAGVGVQERHALERLLLHSGRGPVDRAKVREALAMARHALKDAHPMVDATLDELLTLVGA